MWKGNLLLTKNLLGRNELCNAEDNNSYMSNMRTNMISFEL